MLERVAAPRPVFQGQLGLPAVSGLSTASSASRLRLGQYPSEFTVSGRDSIVKSILVSSQYPKTCVEWVVSSAPRPVS